jgi:aromatic-L-amino-acid/L-tryptophan decarboxylase
VLKTNPELELFTQRLSIATFRYVPADLRADRGPEDEAYLDRLNERLLERVQLSGEAFVSNAVVRGRSALRACIVNFRTALSDVVALPEIVVRLGREIERELRSSVAARGPEASAVTAPSPSRSG